MAELQTVAQRLKSWDKILILSHRSPDGDTLGCAFALARALLALHKQVMFRCADPIPEKFRYMTQGVALGDFTPEKIVTVDVADVQLLGSLQPLGEQADLAIDHHATHRPFARETWVDGTAGAACQMIARLIPALGVQMTPEMADCLYTGISTDTGCFRYPNATPETYRIAATLMEQGARAAYINRVMFDTRSRAAIDLLRRVYASLSFYHEGRTALLYLSDAMIQASGAEEGDLDGIAALPRQVEGVVYGITLRDRGENTYKISLRATEPADAAAVCGRFGGGGHKGAAGCTLTGTLESVIERMVAACGDALQD